MEEERARYLHHQNVPTDPGYRAFLDRLLAPLTAALTPAERPPVGLDFGCGPGPTVSAMLSERGVACSDYDPYFCADDRKLGRVYDFVTCTEVIEHVRDPLPFLHQLDALLAPGGVLGITTGILVDDASFKGWHYHRDFTHIRFFRPETLAWIAARLGWRLERPSRDVALFHKAAARAAPANGDFSGGAADAAQPHPPAC